MIRRRHWHPGDEPPLVIAGVNWNYAGSGWAGDLEVAFWSECPACRRAQFAGGDDGTAKIGNEEGFHPHTDPVSVRCKEIKRAPPLTHGSSRGCGCQTELAWRVVGLKILKGFAGGHGRAI